MSKTELPCREASQLCVKDTMLSSLQMGEGLSMVPGSDLESEFGMPPPCVEQNVDDIPLNGAQHPPFAFRGWTESRLSKYYVGPWREQLEVHMNCTEWGVGL